MYSILFFTYSSKHKKDYVFMEKNIFNFFYPTDFSSYT